MFAPKNTRRIGAATSTPAPDSIFKRRFLPTHTTDSNLFSLIMFYALSSSQNTPPRPETRPHRPSTAQRRVSAGHFRHAGCGGAAQPRSTHRDDSRRRARRGEVLQPMLDCCRRGESSSRPSPRPPSTCSSIPGIEADTLLMHSGVIEAHYFSNLVAQF